jgi:hypothetical protein
MKIPTPQIEVIRNVTLPYRNNDTDTVVSMYGLRWTVNEVEFGCSTYTPETTGVTNNDHYEMMTIQHLLDEFVRWANGEESIV